MKILSVLFLLIVIGCTAPQQRITYNTLYSTHTAVDGGLVSYYALVLQGTISTNDVPATARDYREFQAVYNAAVDLAQGNSNALAPASVISAAAKVLAHTKK